MICWTWRHNVARGRRQLIFFGTSGYRYVFCLPCFSENWGGGGGIKTNSSVFLFIRLSIRLYITKKLKVNMAHIFWNINDNIEILTSFLKRCTLTNKAVGTIWRALSKPPQRRQGPEPRPFWLLVGTPSAFGPELAYRLRVAQPTLMGVTRYFWYTRWWPVQVRVQKLQMSLRKFNKDINNLFTTLLK